MVFWDKLKSFAALYEELADPIKEQYGLTQLEFDILMFLHNNPQYNTAGDIVKVRRLAKSHVSTSVSSLENKGLLAKTFTAANRKNIPLEVTAAADEIIAAGVAAQTTYGHILCRGFSDSEIEQSRELFLRICNNADAELSRRK